MDLLIYLLSKLFFGRLLFVSTNFGAYTVDLSALIMYVVVICTAAALGIFLITRQLSSEHISLGSSVSGVKNFFRELNENFREKKLLQYADRKCKESDVAAVALLNDFDTLPENIRNELIIKFSDRDLTLKDIINETEGNAGDKDSMGANISLVVLMKKFNHLPIGLRDEILKKFIVKGTKTDKDLLSEIFLEQFKFIPDGLDNELFLKLGSEDSNKIKYNLSEIILKYFMDIPDDIRNAMILNLTKSDHDPTLENSVKILINNFLRMPVGVRESAIKNYLRNATVNRSYTNHVRELLNRYEDHLPRQMADMMIKKIKFPST